MEWGCCLGDLVLLARGGALIMFFLWARCCCWAGPKGWLRSHMALVCTSSAR